MLHRLSLCAVLAVFAVSGWASPVDMVRKAYSAEKTAVYAGTLSNTVYLQGRGQQSSVKMHRNGARSRMEYTSGPMRGDMVIDDGTAVYRLDQSSQTVYVAISPPASYNVKLLLASYNPVSLGTETVARRESQVVRLEPRTSGNPKAKLWIDTQTGVVLRNERYSYDGKLATKSVFTAIEFPSKLSVALFTPPPQWKKVTFTSDTSPVTVARIKAETGFEPLKPSYLPQGYVLEGYYNRHTGSGRPAAVLKYTDGLNSITVFERLIGAGRNKGRGRGAGQGWRGGGGRSAPGSGRGQCVMRSDPEAHVAEIEVSGILVTVTANMDPRLVRRIAESF